MARRKANFTPVSQYFEFNDDGTITVLRSGTYRVTVESRGFSFELVRSTRRSGTSSSPGSRGALKGRTRTSGRRSGSEARRRSNV